MMLLGGGLTILAAATRLISLRDKRLQALGLAAIAHCMVYQMAFNLYLFFFILPKKNCFIIEKQVD